MGGYIYLKKKTKKKHGRLSFQEKHIYIIYNNRPTKFQGMTFQSWFKLFQIGDKIRGTKLPTVTSARQKLTFLHSDWGRVTTQWWRSWPLHICVSKSTSIGSDNGLSPDRRQAIVWTNAGILLIGPLHGSRLQWNLNRNLYRFIQENAALENIVWKWRPFCLGLNVFTTRYNVVNWVGNQYRSINSYVFPILSRSDNA